MSKILQKFAETRPKQEETQIAASNKSKKQAKATTTDLKPSSEALAATPSAGNGNGKANGKKPVAKAGKEASSIIYLGHIPSGFFEPEMRKFFTQFGVVRRLHLFRSRKTNNSKGYAFIDFDSPEVAATVAQAMNGYFLMERKLVAEVVPVEKHHKLMFAQYETPLDFETESESESEDNDEGENKEEESAEKREQEAKKQAAALKKKQKKLNALGIEFTIPSVTGKRPAEEEVSLSPAAAAAVEEKKPAKKAKKTQQSEEPVSAKAAQEKPKEKEEEKDAKNSKIPAPKNKTPAVTAAAAVAVSKEEEAPAKAEQAQQQPKKQKKQAEAVTESAEAVEAKKEARPSKIAKLTSKKK